METCNIKQAVELASRGIDTSNTIYAFTRISGEGEFILQKKYLILKKYDYSEIISTFTIRELWDLIPYTIDISGVSYSKQLSLETNEVYFKHEGNDTITFKGIDNISVLFDVVCWLNTEKYI